MDQLLYLSVMFTPQAQGSPPAAIASFDLHCAVRCTWPGSRSGAADRFAHCKGTDEAASVS